MPIRKKKIRFDIVSVFPQAFASYFKESLMQRGQKRGIIDIHTHDLRDFSMGRHRKVDDRPFGGGPGMVLQAEPVLRAVSSLVRSKAAAKKTRIILFSTRGKLLTEAAARRLSRYDRLVLICGRYEGVDERVAAHIADEEISIGEYVLSGGELPALVLVEAVARFIPGFLGKYESLESIKGSYPVYSRPEAMRIRGKAARVPRVLLSGNHRAIEEWRKANR